MDKGWVKYYRAIQDNEFLMNDETCYVIFTKMLIMVNRKGELSGGRQALAKLFHMKDMRLYKALIRLEKHQIVNRYRNNNYTTYRICNWNKYQTLGEQVEEQLRNNPGTTEEHLYKNKKKNKKPIMNDPFELELEEFTKMRRAIKAPLTDHARKSLLEDLERLYPDDQKSQIACLRQSIIHCWKGVFPLKQAAPAIMEQLKIEEF